MVVTQIFSRAMTIEKFSELYGWKGLSLLVADFIEKSPSFTGDKKLATEIGVIMADLESALKELQTRP